MESTGKKEENSGEEMKELFEKMLLAVNVEIVNEVRKVKERKEERLEAEKVKQEKEEGGR